MYNSVVGHIVAHYRRSWDSWALPDLEDVIASTNSGEDEVEVGADWATIEPREQSPPTTASVPDSPAAADPPDLSSSSQTSRGRKRTAPARHAPDAALTSPPRKRSKPRPIAGLSSSIPTPFPSTISADQLRKIRADHQEDLWIAAAKRAGLSLHPVRRLLFSLTPAESSSDIVFRSVSSAPTGRNPRFASLRLAVTLSATLAALPVLSVARHVVVSDALHRLPPPVVLLLVVPPLVVLSCLLRLLLGHPPHPPPLLDLSLVLPRFLRLLSLQPRLLAQSSYPAGLLAICFLLLFLSFLLVLFRLIHPLSLRPSFLRRISRLLNLSIVSLSLTTTTAPRLMLCVAWRAYWMPKLIVVAAFLRPPRRSVRVYFSP
jgi:hypothetical protein